MCAPAAAALLLAALTTLPCRGIDADTASTFPYKINSQETGIRPTINMLYQILHGMEYNQTDLNAEKCCDFNSNVNIVDSTKGAKKFKNTNDRIKRIVSLERNEFSAGNPRETEVNTVTSVVSPAFTTRRKVGETGSSAPLLNYIFDTYTNTHQHRNGKVSPGNSIYAAAAPEIEALVGSTAHLDCKVDSLHDKLVISPRLHVDDMRPRTQSGSDNGILDKSRELFNIVSWVRRKNDEEPMELLTTGTQQYTADDRYSARFIPPDIWRLEVKEVRPSDAANYDCQLSAHPPRTARVTLHVPEVSVRIVDGAGAEVSDQVCEIGSTVALRCEVRGLKMEGGPSLLWYRRESLLNDDTTRGGISVRTEFGANGANSVLRVARVRVDDAGRYTCTVARALPPSPPPAHVILHVIKGESLAELHQGGSSYSKSFNTWLPVVLTLCAVLH